MTPLKYDIALSFGSPDLAHAKNLATALANRGLKVFLDESERHSIWGPDLRDALTKIYRDEAHHVIALISSNYETTWTALERQAAQERARGGQGDYLLAVRLDDTEHPEFPGDKYHQIDIREGLDTVVDLVLRKLRERIPGPDDLHYSIFSFEDTSTGLLKRYSARIQVPRGLRRLALEQTLIKASRELRGHPSYKTHSVSRWGAADAQMLWIFVFDTPDDHKNNNWLARVEWHAPNLPDSLKPNLWGGDRVQDIAITWRPEYLEVSRINTDQTVPKAEYLRAVTAIAEEIEQALPPLRRQFTTFSQTRQNPDAAYSAIKTVEPTISTLHDRAQNVGLAPFECNELSEAFQNMVTMAHNVILDVVPWSRAQRSPTEAVRLAISHLKNYDEDRSAFIFELKKLTKR